MKFGIEDAMSILIDLGAYCSELKRVQDSDNLESALAETPIDSLEWLADALRIPLYVKFYQNCNPHWRAYRRSQDEPLIGKGRSYEKYLKATKTLRNDYHVKLRAMTVKDWWEAAEEYFKNHE